MNNKFYHSGFDGGEAINYKSGTLADVAFNTFYFASTATGVEQYAVNEENGQLVGANDIISASAGDKNPNFVNYSIQSNIDINAGSTKSGNEPQDFNEAWDFHVQAGSPVLAKGTTSFTRHFGTTGIEINGKPFTSPAPSANISAYGTK